MESRIATAARVAEIAPFHVMEVQTAARALEAAGRTVVHMEIGEPDFPTPAPVIEAAQKAIAAGDLYYTSALGLPALREAIAAHYAGHYGVTVAPERIIVTAGSSAALLLVVALIVNRDDRILLADPGYPCNRHFVRVLEGEPVGITGGLFVYADCSAFSDDSERFCAEVLAGCGVAFTPGLDFGKHRAAQHVRLAYTIEMAKLEDGIERLTRFLKH
jgi:aspartate/methionine/tyrosine aminotransferase